jgi:hypothetical protein
MARDKDGRPGWGGEKESIEQVQGKACDYENS